MAMAYSGGFNVDKLKQSLFRKQTMVEKAVEEAVEEAATLIRDEARANAPIDEGFLEEAIHLTNRKTRSGNRAVDVEVSGQGSRGRDIAEYAMEVHERLYPAPAADLNLGPLSEAKQAADPEHTVGGKYLERAVTEKKPEAVDKVRKAVRQAMNV